MKSDSPLFEHPITFKQVGEYLVFSCPDLVITWTTDIPRTRAQLLEAHLKFLAKVKKRKLEFFETKTSLPSPSKLNFATPKKEVEERLSSKQVAKLMKISARKIRMDAEKGLLKGKRTSGGGQRKGAWSFTHADLLGYKAILEGINKESNWVTPLEYARLNGISVNTARNWADTGKVVSKKSSGGHRLILLVK